MPTSKEELLRRGLTPHEIQHNQHRRAEWQDYSGTGLYMITLCIEGRHPLFGHLEGIISAKRGQTDFPHIVLSPLGRTVLEGELPKIHRFYPQIEVWQAAMMPDHLHGILFVQKKMDKDLSRIIRGFKTGCHRAYRELFPSVQYVATQSQLTQQQAPQQPQPRDSHPTHGFLFSIGFNDKLLLRQGQLQRWLDYLCDNPRRLLMKREHPDLFRVQRGLTIAGQELSAIGNRFLLDRPQLLQVQCSRRLTPEQINTQKDRFLTLARQGAVLVSPSISPGEKAIMRAAFEEGLPLIILQENGFTDLAKPGGQRMEACQRGQLLLLAPWAHHNERLTIRRGQCLQLNELARMICERR